MNSGFRAVKKTSLADDIAERIVEMLRSGAYDSGARLPSIMEMSRSFGVGHPTLREALKKLEMVGAVEIRHGSGVYVGDGQDALVVSNPIYGGVVSKKLLLDLIETRIPIETKAARLAACHAREEHLSRMTELLEEAGNNLDDDVLLNATNMAFHREIAEASGNTVLLQLQNVLTKLFQNEQRALLDIFASRERDHDEHRSILDALKARDGDEARRLMTEHLAGVRDVLVRWDPDSDPIG